MAALFSVQEGVARESSFDSLRELPDLLEGGALHWIDIQGLADTSGLEELGKRFGLDPLVISDVVNVGQRPKLENYEGGMYMVVRRAYVDREGELAFEQISIFFRDQLVISFQEDPGDSLKMVRERVRSGALLKRSATADYLACMLVDAVVDGYFPMTESFAETLESLEERVFDGGGSELLGQIYRTKQDLGRFRRATFPLRDALSAMLREDAPISSFSKLHVRDALDHVMQVTEVNESYRELSMSLIDVHLSLVGQRTNEVMRVLTVISAIFIPLTFLAGIYGMNFNTQVSGNMPELNWTYGYAYFWGFTLLLTASLLFLFRRLGWLRG